MPQLIQFTALHEQLSTFLTRGFRQKTEPEQLRHQYAVSTGFKTMMSSIGVVRATTVTNTASVHVANCCDNSAPK